MAEQGTTAWLEARLGRVTASRICDVMAKPTTAAYQNYLAQIVCERLTGEPTDCYVSAAMQHGTDTEPQARAFYELEVGVDVRQVGFIPHPKIQMSGASPDGIIGGDGLVEIKCPQPANHIKTLTGAGIDRKYLLQMQWQMDCTGREWCDFVSFCPMLPAEMQMFRERVERDAELVEDIRAAVTKFLAEAEAKVEALNRLYREAA